MPRFALVDDVAELYPCLTRARALTGDSAMMGANGGRNLSPRDGA
jgi:hypothetical protein